MSGPGNRSWFVSSPSSTTWCHRAFAEDVDNLWLLGGEIIRDLHNDPALRKLSADRLLPNAIHEGGGPLIYNGSEDQQRSFDSTCRKLHRFLNQAST